MHIIKYMKSEELIIETYDIKEYNKQKRINLRSNAPFDKGEKVVILKYDEYLKNFSNGSITEAKEVAILTREIADLNQIIENLTKENEEYKEKVLADANEINKLHSKINLLHESNGSKKDTKIVELAKDNERIIEVANANIKQYNASINNIITTSELLIKENNTALINKVNKLVKGTGKLKLLFNFTITEDDIEATKLTESTISKLKESKPTLEKLLETTKVEPIDI